MKEIAKPHTEGMSDAEAVEAVGLYGQRIVKQQLRMIDKLADSFKPADGAKRLTNTSYDKMLAQQKTVHDLMSENPAKYAEIKRIFGI